MDYSEFQLWWPTLEEHVRLALTRCYQRHLGEAKGGLPTRSG